MTNFATELLVALEKGGLKGLSVKKEGNITQIIKPTGEIISSIPDNLILTEIEKNIRKKYTEINAIIKRTSTNATVKPSEPNQKIDIGSYDVLDLSLVFDATFKTNGNLIVLINDKVFLSLNAGDLTDTDEFDLQLQTKSYSVENFKNVQLFAWVSSGTGAVTINITRGS